MKLKKLVVTGLMMGIALAVTPAWGDEGWLVDFQKARQQAAAEGKSILMEFTGSDWCPPCKALKAQVLDSEVFQKEAPEHFVLLKLDNPRDKSHQSPEEIEQYQKLSAEFKITGVPTIILADHEGKPFAKMVGYGGDPAEAYVQKLTDQKQVREKRDAAFAEAEQAQGLEKARALDKAISVIDSELAVAQYGEVVEEIIQLDADNEAKLKEKYDGIRRLGQIREALDDVRRSAAADPQGAITKIDELLTTLQPTGEAMQEVLFMKGSLQFRQDRQAAKATLEAAAKVAPDTRLGQQIQQILATQFDQDEAP
jgi:thioredoxin-related protein